MLLLPSSHETGGCVVLTAHFTDEKMEVRRTVGRASVRTQSWDAKPKGCLLLPHSCLLSLLVFLQKGRGSRGVTPQAPVSSVKQSRARHSQCESCPVNSILFYFLAVPGVYSFTQVVSCYGTWGAPPVAVSGLLRWLSLQSKGFRFLSLQ